MIDASGFGLDQAANLEERAVTSDPRVADTDDDGLDDFAELLNRTDPRDVDTDGDGLRDLDEVDRWRTSPVSVDTDGDATDLGAAPNVRLFDRAELNLVEDPDDPTREVPGPGATSPSLADTDGDGVGDAAEIDEPTRSTVVANLPSIDVRLDGDPDIRLDVTYSEGAVTEQSFGQSIARETSSSLARADSQSTELSSSQSTTIGAEVESGFPPSATVSVSRTFQSGSRARRAPR